MNPWESSSDIRPLVARLRALSPRVERLAQAVAKDGSRRETLRPEVQRACADVEELRADLDRIRTATLKAPDRLLWSETQLDAVYLSEPSDEGTSLRLRRFIRFVRGRMTFDRTPTV